MRGVKFGDKHSYTHFNLVLTSVEIPPANPKTSYVDIQGGDGSIDLSEALGEIKFENRECKFVFTVFPTDNWEEKKRDVSNYLNGKVMKIILDKDPDYYWEGRCSVDNYESNKNIHKIAIKAIVKPYKYKNTVKTASRSGNGTLTLSNNGRKSIVPTIEATANTTISFDDNTVEITPSTTKILDLCLQYQESKTLTITTTGTITFTWREGDL